MNVNTFDLNLLRAFDALTTTRHVSVAGARIGLSQPAMSNALARLRRLCNDPLFVRTSQGMQPTPFAEEIAPAVRQALALISSALEGQRFDPTTSTRRFTLILSDLGAVLYLPALLTTLGQQAPQINLQVLQVSEDRILQVMENLGADLIVGNPEFSSRTLYQQRLFQDSHVCLMRKGHPLAGQPFTRNDYVQAEHIVTRLPWGATFIERMLVNKGIQRRVQVEVPNYIVLLRVMACTDLIATIPSLAVQLAPDPEQLIVGELPFPMPDTQVKQFWHPRFHHDAGNRWLRRLFVQLFSDSATPEVAPT